MIKTVLFDLDNTLIDFMLMKRKSCEAAVEAMIDAGLEMNKNKVLNILFDLYDKYGIEYKKIFQKLLKKLINRIDYRILAEGIVAYRKAQIAYVKTYPKTIPTLLELKEMNVQLGIVSDAPSVNAWIRLIEMGIQDFFNVVITLHDTGKEKPSPMPFKKALEKIKEKPENILFVGDNPEKDIKGAKRVGIKTALAKYGTIQKNRKAKADYEIEDISEVVNIVEKENKF